MRETGGGGGEGGGLEGAAQGRGSAEWAEILPRLQGYWFPSEIRINSDQVGYSSGLSGGATEAVLVPVEVVVCLLSGGKEGNGVWGA